MAVLHRDTCTMHSEIRWKKKQSMFGNRPFQVYWHVKVGTGRLSRRRLVARTISRQPISRRNWFVVVTRNEFRFVAETIGWSPKHCPVLVAWTSADSSPEHCPLLVDLKSVDLSLGVRACSVLLQIRSGRTVFASEYCPATAKCMYGQIGRSIGRKRHTYVRT